MALKNTPNKIGIVRFVFRQNGPNKSDLEIALGLIPRNLILKSGSAQFLGLIPGLIPGLILTPINSSGEMAGKIYCKNINSCKFSF